jgi:beta-lactamase superfamily II metal-dependent hydrolase
MMLARFGAAGAQTSSQHAVLSAVTPQRAIINIASAGSVTQMN